MFLPGMRPKLMGALFRSLIRVLVATAVVTVALAILLGRQELRQPELREAVEPRFRPISGHLLRGWNGDLQLLDVATGQLQQVRLAEGDSLEHAAVSPWRDGRGQNQVVGVWRRRDSGGTATSTALARYVYPSWTLIDQYDADVLPASPPCWFPDRSARIVFTAWDGGIYRLDFEPTPGDGTSEPDEPGQPREITWQIPRPADCVLASDPCFPVDPRLKGKLLVTLDFSHPDARRFPGELLPGRSQLWWLELDANRSAIVGASRLITDQAVDSSQPVYNESSPVVTAGPDGGLRLAYLAQARGGHSYHVRLAPLTIDARGTPHVDASVSTELIANTIHTAPNFSEDGRWLLAIQDTAPTPGKADRVFIDSVLGALKVRTDAVRTAGRGSTSFGPPRPLPRLDAVPKRRTRAT